MMLARRYLPALAALLLAFLVLGFLPPVALGQAPCTAPKNAIEAENCLPGTPASQWSVQGAGSPNIQGFTTDISVNAGQTIFFKISTPATSYRIDIYRLGYYQGNDGRFITSISVSLPQPQIQPSCLSDSATGLIDCGNWGISASWTVPSTATSGFYFARLVRLDTGEVGAILFVVRNDSSHSDILEQASDTTWQAYNDYGGNSLYTGNPAGRAFKVSYNRPVNPAQSIGWDFFIHEYPIVRFLEANGYDVTYSTGVDTDRNGSLITQHRVFLSVGHDEYWSGGQRANVEAARDAAKNPVNLAFFSGNEVFWKTRWETSIDGNNTPYRTLVCYKETSTVGTYPRSVIDPADPPTWTGFWRDARFSPPADGGRPENALTGTWSAVSAPQDNAITVPQADGRMRFWRNTSVASLGPGQVATLSQSTLGYESDEDPDNGVRPAGLIRLSTTTVAVSQYLYFSPTSGYYFTNGTETHHLTFYRAASGALVFGAGTIHWPWGVESDHAGFSSPPPDPSMRQAMVNLFADMGVQPATLQSGLVAATASTDTIPPTSTITSPAPGTMVTAGSQVTVTGTAQDFGGGVVGGVEVSVDGGATWHPAAGRENWSYVFTAATSGPLNVQSRAVDDSGNLEVAYPTITLQPANQTVTVGQTATFTAAATGSPTPTVQWQVSTDNGATFNNVPGATSTTLSFTTALSQSGNRYRAVFTNSAGMATTTAATLTVNAGPPPPPSGTVTLQNTNSNLCIDTGGSTSFNALIQSACSTSNTQKFTLTTAPVSGWYYLVSAASNLCWDVAGGSGSAGALIQQYTCGAFWPEYYQLKAVSGGYEILSANMTNGCVDVVGASTASGAHIEQNTCTGSTNQIFNIVAPSNTPTITTQPTNQTVTVGQTATFAAAATGSPTPTVQWQVSTDNGATFNNVSGATSTTLSFTTTLSQNGSQYRAVFTNSAGTAMTAAATLTVNSPTPPAITTQPTNQTVAAGQTATFTAAATGSPTPTVQWQVSIDGGTTFSNVSGATSTTLSFTTTLSQNGNQYRAVFTNSAGTAMTTPAMLTVNNSSTPPTITTQPANQTVTAGQTATFTAAATGSPTPTVQWQVSTDGGATFNNISGATSTTLSFTTALSQNGNRYRAVFTNAVGTAMTTPATLTVNPAPPPSGTVTLQNTNSNLCIDTGGSTSFNALIQSACSTSNTQKFTLTTAPVSGWYYLVSAASNLCWDVAGGSGSAGALIQQYTCGAFWPEYYQLKAVSGGYEILSANMTNGCVDVVGASTASGAHIEQNTCTGSANQIFNIH